MKKFYLKLRLLAKPTDVVCYMKKGKRINNLIADHVPGRVYGYVQSHVCSRVNDRVWSLVCAGVHNRVFGRVLVRVSGRVYKIREVLE